MAVTGKNGFYEQHTAALDGAASTHVVSIRKIIWHGMTAPQHTLQVENGKGTIVIPAIKAADTGAAIVTVPIQLDFNPPLVLTGVETAVLGSGTVVYLYA